MLSEFKDVSNSSHFLVVKRRNDIFLLLFRVEFALKWTSCIFWIFMHGHIFCTLFHLLPLIFSHCIREMFHIWNWNGSEISADFSWEKADANMTKLTRLNNYHNHYSLTSGSFCTFNSFFLLGPNLISFLSFLVG